jgi:VanZ family protein
VNTVSLWGPVIVQMAIIFGSSSLSEPSIPDGVSDKSGHLIGYVILSALMLRALAGGRVAGVNWRTALLAIVFSTVYGASDEFHQSFVPHRAPDVRDLIADAAGAGIAAALGGILRIIAGWRNARPAAYDHD